MSGKSLAFTERDREVVREVTRFGVMSRDQLMRLKFFSSKTRANDRLKRLVDVGYLAARRTICSRSVGDGSRPSRSRATHSSSTSSR